MYCSTDEEDIIEHLKECQGIIVRNIRLTGEMIEKAPNLRVIARHGVGVEQIDTDAAWRRGIWVTFAPESNTESVAEQVIGAMISVVRKLKTCHEMVCEGQYNERNQICGTELSGKTLGIIGLGRIGHSVAAKAHFGLNMEVIAYDPYKRSQTAEWVRMMESLTGLLKRADVVSLHMPLTEETRYFMGREELAVMKKSAVLINYARGALIEGDALREALENRWIGGAALDVFETEPVRKDDRLCALPQVLLTPHTASFTEESLDRMALHAAMTVHQVLSGETPSWYVVQGVKETLNI